MLIIGMRFVVWGSERTPQPMHCGKCGAQTEFLARKGMRFITVFFIPLIPISGVTNIVECPSCHTRFQPKAAR